MMTDAYAALPERDRLIMEIARVVFDDGRDFDPQQLVIVQSVIDEYERRRAAGESAEPVAWRYRWKLDGEWVNWRVSDASQKHPNLKDFEQQPLYAHPPAPEPTQPAEDADMVEHRAMMAEAAGQVFGVNSNVDTVKVVHKPAGDDAELPDVQPRDYLALARMWAEERAQVKAHKATIEALTAERTSMLKAIRLTETERDRLHEAMRLANASVKDAQRAIDAALAAQKGEG